MEDEFEFSVVETLHKLSGKLATGVKSDRVDNDFSRLPKKAGGEQFSIGGVPRGSAGLPMLPNHGARDSDAWWIFVRAATGSDGSASSLAPVGSIEAALPIHQFVATAYQHILGRSVDFDGLQNYQQLIEAGQLPRHDFLKILASSDEAKGRNLQILIVPVAGRRLSSDAPAAEGTSKPHLPTTPLSSEPEDSEVFSGDVITLIFN